MHAHLLSVYSTSTGSPLYSGAGKPVIFRYISFLLGIKDNTCPPGAVVAQRPTITAPIVLGSTVEYTREKPPGVRNYLLEVLHRGWKMRFSGRLWPHLPSTRGSNVLHEAPVRHRLCFCLGVVILLIYWSARCSSAGVFHQKERLCWESSSWTRLFRYVRILSNHKYGVYSVNQYMMWGLSTAFPCIKSILSENGGRLHCWLMVGVIV